MSVLLQLSDCISKLAVILHRLSLKAIIAALSVSVAVAMTQAQYSRGKGERDHLKIFWQLGMNLLPDGTSACFFLVAGLPDRDHIVCVHLMHGD